jgi:hypothetical protein
MTSWPDLTVNHPAAGAGAGAAVSRAVHLHHAPLAKQRLSGSCHCAGTSTCQVACAAAHGPKSQAGQAAANASRQHLRLLQTCVQHCPVQQLHARRHAAEVQLSKRCRVTASASYLSLGRQGSPNRQRCSCHLCHSTLLTSASRLVHPPVALGCSFHPTGPPFVGTPPPLPCNEHFQPTPCGHLQQHDLVPAPQPPSHPPPTLPQLWLGQPCMLQRSTPDCRGPVPGNSLARVSMLHRHTWEHPWQHRWHQAGDARRQISHQAGGTRRRGRRCRRALPLAPPPPGSHSWP